MNFLQTINIWWFLNTLALARSCLMYVVSMERADLCFVHIYILCVCVCVFPVLPLSYLIIMLIHKTLKRQPICVTHLLNWIDIEWLRHTKKYKHSEEWAVNSPHYRLFFWTISRFKARILTKKRDNSHKNKFYNKIKLFFL